MAKCIHCGAPLEHRTLFCTCCALLSNLALLCYMEFVIKPKDAA